MEPTSPLLGQYRTAINRIQLAYASLVLWSYPDTPSLFDAIHDAIDPKLHLFPNVKRLIHDEKTMKIATDDFYMLAYRSALTDLFPLTKLYCHETGQLDKLKAQPWFTFWRILRNCFAHDLVFNFNPYERSLLPVTWSGVSIDASMNGKPLTHGQMSYAKMLELLETARTLETWTQIGEQMKKLIIFALLVAFGWNYYQKSASSTQAQTQIEPQAFEEPVTLINQPTESFSCDGRQHCSQMGSRAEAEFFLRSCPDTKMDGDHDGIPCENDSRF